MYDALKVSEVAKASYAVKVSSEKEHSPSLHWQTVVSHSASVSVGALKLSIAGKILTDHAALGFGEDSRRPAGQSEQENRGELRVAHLVGSFVGSFV